MSEHREQQKDEIDLLQNIIFDKMKIVESEPNFIIFMEIYVKNAVIIVIHLEK